MDFKIIKSWHIALVGFLFQLVYDVQEVLNSNYLCTKMSVSGTMCQSLSDYTPIEAIIGYIPHLPIWGIIITLYLYFAKDGRGTEVSIVVGYILIMFIENIILGIFLIIAGIHMKYSFTSTATKISKIKGVGITSWHIAYLVPNSLLIIGTFMWFSAGGSSMALLGLIMALIFLSSAAIAYVAIWLSRNTSKNTKR